MVFIVGCPRSGTTWAQSILSAHPNVVSGAESQLFPTLYGRFAGRGRAVKRRSAALDTYDRWARGDVGPGAGPHRWVTRERLCELLDEFVLDTSDDDERAMAAKAAFRAVLEEYAIASGADASTVLVEKTPRHLYHAETILQWWPTARIVELIRDGRDVCVSLQHKAMVKDWAPSERIDQIGLWVRAVRHGATARQRPVAQGRWLSVHYEALHNDIHAEVRRLLEFSGLPADEELLNTIVRGVGFSAQPAADPLQHRRKGIVGDYRNHFSEDDQSLFRDLAGEVFEVAGYRF